MSLSEERARQLLQNAGAILTGHFVGTNGKHFNTYVAKDRATMLTSVVSELCEGIAELYHDADIEVAVAPAVGGIALSQWTAHHLSRIRSDHPEVLALYAEHDDEVVEELQEGIKVIHRRPAFLLKRGYDADVQGKKVLLVEDILTTGGSAKRTAEAIKAAGGILVGVGVLANGGNVTAAGVGADRLESLMNVKRQLFTEEECADHGLCNEGIPVNTDFGHGAAFLQRREA